MLYYFDDSIFLLANGYYKEVEVIKNGNSYDVKVLKNGKQIMADDKNLKPSISTFEAYNKFSKNVKRNLDIN